MFSNKFFSIEFWSKDRRFGLMIDQTNLQTLLCLCQKADRYETGGVFVGNYSDVLDCAIVKYVIGPGKDSRFGTTWFERGAHHLNKYLLQYWQKGKGYYLGEWHFHPAVSPVPSITDISSMHRIAQDPKCQCPQPILVIIGGLPPYDWSIAAYVCIAPNKVIELILKEKKE